MPPGALPMKPGLPGKPGPNPAPKAPPTPEPRRAWLPWRRMGALAALMRQRRGDLTVAALGVVLCLCCALFPWYIVLNPEKFGIWKGLKFAGNDNPRPALSTSDADRIGLPLGLPALDQGVGGDSVPTGATPDEEQRITSASDDQPFPGDEVRFSLVYAANGRAMIADDSGMYVVERGSLLPDNSTVASIEQRDGKWVLVTSDDRVLPLAQP